MLMDSNEAQSVDTRTLQPAGIRHPNIEYHDIECGSQRLKRRIQPSRRSYDEPFAVRRCSNAPRTIGSSSTTRTLANLSRPGYFWHGDVGSVRWDAFLPRTVNYRRDKPCN